MRTPDKNPLEELFPHLDKKQILEFERSLEEYVKLAVGIMERVEREEKLKIDE